MRELGHPVNFITCHVDINNNYEYTKKPEFNFPYKENLYKVKGILYMYQVFSIIYIYVHIYAPKTIFMK